MAKSKKSTSNIPLIDAGSLLLAIWFVYSVINNARDLIVLGIKNSPATLAGIIAILLIAYDWSRRKSLSKVNIVTLSVLATAAAIWFLGLSTRGAW